MDDHPLPPRTYPDEPPPRPPGRLPWLVLLLGLMLVLLLLPSIVERVMYGLVRGRERAQVEVAREQLPTVQLAELSRQFSLVAKAIGPSVVHLDTVQEEVGRGRRLVLDGEQQLRTFGQGSGVIVDEDGYILTNNHVVESASEITVKIGGGETRPATIVGLDETTDLAVLKIPAGSLIAAEWGDSDALEDGALVWAVGNPFGLDRSVTFGIISAKNRHGFRGASPYQDFLQTDAAVNPGNSGGPLVDVTGKVVGINTAIVGRGYQGVSFSIPASIAKDVYERLRANGRVVRGYMGVQLDDVSPEVAREMGLETAGGALVVMVSPGSPAAAAGVQDDDIVVEWNGQPITNATELTLLVGKTEIGSKAKVVVIRGGKRVEFELEVGARPARIGR